MCLCLQNLSLDLILSLRLEWIAHVSPRPRFSLAGHGFDSFASYEWPESSAFALLEIKSGACKCTIHHPVIISIGTSLESVVELGATASGTGQTRSWNPLESIIEPVNQNLEFHQNLEFRLQDPIPPCPNWEYLTSDPSTTSLKLGQVNRNRSRPMDQMRPNPSLLEDCFLASASPLKSETVPISYWDRQAAGELDVSC